MMQIRRSAERGHKKEDHGAARGESDDDVNGNEQGEPCHPGLPDAKTIESNEFFEDPLGIVIVAS